MSSSASGIVVISLSKWARLESNAIGLLGGVLKVWHLKYGCLRFSLEAAPASEKTHYK